VLLRMTETVLLTGNVSLSLCLCRCTDDALRTLCCRPQRLAIDAVYNTCRNDEMFASLNSTIKVNMYVILYGVHVRRTCMIV